MSDKTEDESGIVPDEQAEDQTLEKTPMPLRARICLAVGGLVLLSGVLIGFGITDWYFSLWTSNPGWNSLLTATILVGAGLFFERTRPKATTILLAGFCLFVLFWMAVFSGYGWYVFFTTGLDISGKFPLVINGTGGALVLAGILMLIVCGCIHFMDGESFLCRVAVGVSWFTMVSATALFMLSLSSQVPTVVNRKLTNEEISTLRGCEVSEGSVKVRCLLPDATKQGAAR